MHKKYYKKLGKVMKMPKFTIKHYMKVGVNSVVRLSENDDYLPLPATQEKFPVAIFSHGWCGMPEMYTMFAESLASNGYIVVAIYHTDGSCAVVETPYGSIDFDYMMPQFDLDPQRKYDPLNEADRQLQEKYRAHQLCVRTEDVRICLNVCKLFDDPTRKATFLPDGYYTFKRRVDMSKLVCFGHSFGGCTTVSSITLCDSENEPCFKLGVSLDGWMEPLEFTEDLSQLEREEITSVSQESFVYRLTQMKHFPILAFINSEVWQWEKNRGIMEMIGGYLVRHKILQYMWTVPNTGHHNYNDVGAIMPKLARKLKILQTDVDPGEHLQQLCEVLVDFIQLHLTPDSDLSHFSRYLLNEQTSTISPQQINDH